MREHNAVVFGSVEKWEKALEQFSLQIDEATRIIEAQTAGKRSVSGTIDCPRCRGRLRYSVKHNGHIWGKCDTPDCLNWME